ncbi:MAG: trypsin-like peptidase domain-containing protein [Janthinobacterium lividum]
MKSFFCALSVLTALACLGFAGSAHADDVSGQVQALITKQAPAIVTVRAVLKVTTKGEGAQTAESRTEMQGVVVDPSGLIMVSSVPFSATKMMEMMGMPSDAADSGPTITPTDFKVVFANEEKEYSAFLVATDTTLGLTFLKIEDLAGRTPQAVTFASAPAPALGDPVYALSRLSKGYDYAPYFSSARVSGIITKPRAAVMLDGGISDLGLPIFTATGDAAGVLTSVASGVKPEGSNEAMGMQMMMRIMGGGGGNHSGVFLVPASAVSPVIAQAQARSIQMAATRATATPDVKKPAAPAPAAK